MPRTIAIALLASMMVASAATMAVGETVAKTELKPFNVTVRVFDPMEGAASAQDCGLLFEGAQT